MNGAFSRVVIAPPPCFSSLSCCLPSPRRQAPSGSYCRAAGACRRRRGHPRSVLLESGIKPRSPISNENRSPDTDPRRGPRTSPWPPRRTTPRRPRPLPASWGTHEIGLRFLRARHARLHDPRGGLRPQASARSPPPTRTPGWKGRPPRRATSAGTSVATSRTEAGNPGNRKREERIRRLTPDK